MKRRALLRVLRMDRQPKVNQTYVAKRAGMSYSRYWQIENGEGSPVKPDEQKAIAVALGVKVGDIAWPDVQRRDAAPQADEASV